MLNVKKSTRDVRIAVLSQKQERVIITDNAYGNRMQTMVLKAGKPTVFIIESGKSGGWYDFTITLGGNDAFSQRYAGRIENDLNSISDPAMAKRKS
ncbi:hypothetical protein D3C78_1737060 [compost metagenome]